MPISKGSVFDLKDKNPLADDRFQARIMHSAGASLL